jgi:DNA-directed RNA polymerase specialized sigma24 family protein
VRLLRLARAQPDTSLGVAARDPLEGGFRRLTPDQRIAIVLHFYLGLTAQEIADTLGAPTGTVKSRLHYATEALRATLEADARRQVAAANGRLA